MKFYSFEGDYNISIENTDDDTVSVYNLFNKTLVDNDAIKDTYYIVNNDMSCRFDNICDDIYGTPDYSEELLVMNNILNPFSIEDGDILRYAKDSTRLANMQVQEETSITNNKLNVLNINKNKNSSNVTLPPSINPGLSQLDIDYNKNTISVINKFK